jgi:hypothetical protein
MNAANTVNVKQRKLFNFSAFESSPFTHRNIPTLTSIDFRCRGGAPSIVF